MVDPKYLRNFSSALALSLEFGDGTSARCHDATTGSSHSSGPKREAEGVSRQVVAKPTSKTAARRNKCPIAAIQNIEEC